MLAHVSQPVVRGKIGVNFTEAETMADLIIQMETSHPGRLYKIFLHGRGAQDFDLAIGYLNA